MSVRDFARNAVNKLLGPMVFRHVIMPRATRERREAQPFDSGQWWTSYYGMVSGEKIDDGYTHGPETDRRRMRYVYNSAENCILDLLFPQKFPEGPKVLDIGSGAGHWVAFYLKELGASRVLGCDIAPPAVDALREKYRGNDGVDFIVGDVSEPDWTCGETFDVINAIAVLYHIVDDVAWDRAIGNLARHLEPGGAMLIGEYFGMLSANVLFHTTDKFGSWEEQEARAGEKKDLLVTKRIRSRRRWRRSAAKCGLTLERVAKAINGRHIQMWDNNVALFRKPVS